MAVIWLAPMAILLLACGLTWRWQQLAAGETERLRQGLRALPVMAADTRAVQIESDRIARATSATGDYFASAPRH